MTGLGGFIIVDAKDPRWVYDGASGFVNQESKSAKAHGIAIYPTREDADRVVKLLQLSGVSGDLEVKDR